MAGIDLHTHSTASDGTLTPSELMLAAKKTGLEAIALTDHDTTGGLEEAMILAEKLGIEFIPGCELSVVSPSGNMHILGYWIPVGMSKLSQSLESLRQRRHERNHMIMAKLNALGMEIAYEDVLAVAGGDAVGRPHIAQVMHAKGFVDSISTAFRVYLGSEGRAYVPKEKLGPRQAIDLLKSVGATVVLAHPFLLGLQGPDLRGVIRQLKEYGLDGLEAYYTLHRPDQTLAYVQIARDLDLLVTGGSDFHGTVKPDVHLGIGFGNLFVPYSILTAMKEHRRQRGLTH
ncbi:MAG TPA: PHP domain-containing protein [Desulfonatronum sp.]|nr:PHP domain-containing protein [Desulfonatronum sp.]